MNKPVESPGTTIVPLWIGGRKQPASSARHGEVTNPATGRMSRRVPMCNAADVDAAVKSATAAYPGWRDTPPLRRARVMQKFLQLLQASQKDLARLVTAQHRDKVAGYIDQGVKEGAKLVADGRGHQVPGYEGGNFLGTTLFDDVTPAMRIYQDEIFGPVLVVLREKTLDDAIALVNRNPYANGTAIFTESGGAARRFENEIQVGMVGVNVPIPVPVAFYSFGGWKGSLFGDLHVHGMEGVKFYTRTKVITSRWPHQDTPAPGLNMPTLG